MDKDNFSTKNLIYCITLAFSALIILCLALPRPAFQSKRPEGRIPTEHSQFAEEQEIKPEVIVNEEPIPVPTPPKSPQTQPQKSNTLAQIPAKAREQPSQETNPKEHPSELAAIKQTKDEYPNAHKEALEKHRQAMQRHHASIAKAREQIARRPEKTTLHSQAGKQKIDPYFSGRSVSQSTDKKSSLEAESARLRKELSRLRAEELKKYSSKVQDVRQKNCQKVYVEMMKKEPGGPGTWVYAHDVKRTEDGRIKSISGCNCGYNAEILRSLSPYFASREAYIKDKISENQRESWDLGADIAKLKNQESRLASTKQQEVLSYVPPPESENFKAIKREDGSVLITNAQ